MREPTISEVLDLAADQIEIRGWNGVGPGNQYTCGMDPWGGGAASAEPVCVEGAIAAVIGIEIPSDPTLKEAVLKIRECPAYRAMQEYLELDRELWTWNDSLHRTKAEVIEALRGAAAVERVKEESYNLQEVAV